MLPGVLFLGGAIGGRAAIALSGAIYCGFALIAFFVDRSWRGRRLLTISGEGIHYFGTQREGQLVPAREIEEVRVHGGWLEGRLSDESRFRFDIALLQERDQIEVAETVRELMLQQRSGGANPSLEFARPVSEAAARSMSKREPFRIRRYAGDSPPRSRKEESILCQHQYLIQWGPIAIHHRKMDVLDPDDGRLIAVAEGGLTSAEGIPMVDYENRGMLTRWTMSLKEPTSPRPFLTFDRWPVIRSMQIYDGDGLLIGELAVRFQGDRHHNLLLIDEKGKTVAKLRFNVKNWTAYDSANHKLASIRSTSLYPTFGSGRSRLFSISRSVESHHLALIAAAGMAICHPAF